MCHLCIKSSFPPDRGNMCLEDGAYLLNFAGCTECGCRDPLKYTQRERMEEEDQEEIITYQHVCASCSHTVAHHEYRFQVVDGYQQYSMECTLCGTAQDERKILP